MPQFRKVTWRKIAIGYVTLVILLELWLVFFYFPEATGGEWDETQEALSAKGESLAMADFLPAPIPDADNFFADPLWRELSDRAPVQNGKGTVLKAKLSEDRWQLGVFKRPPTDAERKLLNARFPEFSPADWSLAREKIARKVWQGGNSEDRVQRAEFMRETLASLNPVLLRFRELGLRPDGIFPLNYADGIAMSMEHASVLMRAAQVLEMRGAASLALGYREEAKDDVFLIFRLADAIRHEPPLISLLLRSAILNIGLDLLSEGLATQAWTEAELNDLIPLLDEWDLPAGLAKALRFERAMFLETTFPSITRRGFEPLAQAVGSQSRGWLHPAAWLYRLYAMPGDKAFLCHSIQAWVETLDAVSARGMTENLFPSPTEKLLEKNFSPWFKLNRLVSLLTLPSLDGSFAIVAKRQNRIAQIQIAIALEQYRISHGRYPASLQDLVPRQLAKLPKDLITLEPFRYRLESPERFALWSVGWDEVDDGGRPGMKPKEGDWVWGLTAEK